MITGLMYLFYYTILFIASPLLLLPDVTLSSNVTSAITSAGNYLSIVNSVVPVSSLVAIILLMVSIDTGIFTYKIVKWLYTKIPGIK